MANLASVLGVIRATNYDKNIEFLNNIQDNSIRLISVKTNEGSGMPFSTNTFLLLTFAVDIGNGNNRAIQQAFGVFGQSIRQQKFRVLSSTWWSEWA